MKRHYFENTGLMVEGVVITLKTKPSYEGSFTTLKNCVQSGKAPDEFYINPIELDKWKYLKGSKKETRINRQGFRYKYSEGGVPFPDALDKPSRTIVTREGGKSPSRFKHVIQTPNGFRRLLPVELERLNMFPDEHTKLPGVSDTKRAFLMGNALVVGVVERIGIVLDKKIKRNFRLSRQPPTNTIRRKRYDQ